MVGETEGVLRLAVTFGLTFVLGFERQLRGSPAGNRTFSLIGLGAAVIGLLSDRWPRTRWLARSPGSGSSAPAWCSARPKDAPKWSAGHHRRGELRDRRGGCRRRGRTPAHRHHRDHPRAGLPGAAARPRPETVRRRPLRVPFRPRQPTTTPPKDPATDVILGRRARQCQRVRGHQQTLLSP